ncbi:MAG TPA: LysM peptidoglycan-binding domain-containing protein [Thermoanaerobaculia bacterium]
MALEKLKIKIETQREVFADEVQVLFNPNQLSLDKQVSWRKLKVAERDSVEAGFTYGSPFTLTMDLFFDSYEEQKNVRTYTDRVAKLVKVNGDLHRPPRCQLQWGEFDFDGIWWVVTRMSQRFTLFLANGFPARATLNCSFQQWRSGEEEAKETKKASPDVAKTRVVRRGETLSGIAAEEYQDPALWRPLAEANRIDDPRRLRPGQVLAIPPLQPGRKVGR